MQKCELDFISRNHDNQTMSRLNEYFQQNQMCDVTLVVGNERIDCHRVVLAAASDYFHAMFNSSMRESHEKTVVLKEVDFESVEALVKYAYSGKIQLSEATCESLLTTANRLLFLEVVEACSSFFKSSLRPSNALGIKEMASSLHCCSSLYTAAEKFIEGNFLKVVDSQEFLALHHKSLSDLLSNDLIDVPNEEAVYHSLDRWLVAFRQSRQDNVQEDPRTTPEGDDLLNSMNNLSFLNSEQSQNGDESIDDIAAELLDHIRLPLLDKKFFSDHVLYNQCFMNSSCRDLINETFRFHFEPQECHRQYNKRTKPRRSTVGSIFALGGNDAPFQPNPVTIERYDARLNQWRHVGNISDDNRLQFGAAVLNGVIYVVGGRSGFETLNSVLWYQYNPPSWSICAPMNVHRHGLGVTVLNSLLYAAGGHDGWSYLNSVERFDSLSRSWSIIASMNSARSSFPLVALDSSLYAVGGRDGSSSLKSVECYDPHRNTWTNVAPMNTRRVSAGCCAHNGYLFAAGGRQKGVNVFCGDEYHSLQSIERYDPSSNIWSPIVGLSKCQDALGLVSLGERIVAVGGHDGQASINSVESLDTSSEDSQWVELAPLGTPRVGLSALILKL